MESQNLVDQKKYLIKRNKPKAVYHNDWKVATYYKDHDCFNLNPTIHFEHISRILDLEKIVSGYCECNSCISGTLHKSDCAVHNEPAESNKPCNCL